MTEDAPDDVYGTLFYENERVCFYINENTLMYEKRMREYDEHGIVIDDILWKVFYCIPKDDSEPTYVAYDKRGKPFMDWKDPYTFDFKTKLYRMDLAEENHILNLAKRRKETKGSRRDRQ